MGHCPLKLSVVSWKQGVQKRLWPLTDERRFSMLFVYKVNIIQFIVVEVKTNPKERKEKQRLEVGMPHMFEAIVPKHCCVNINFLLRTIVIIIL